MSRTAARSFAMPNVASVFAVPGLLWIASVTLPGALLTKVYLHTASVGELNPVSTTVSDLIFADGVGWLFEVSTALLAIASTALPIALARTRLPRGSLITAVLGLWSLGLIVAAVFPTDPLSAETISLAGLIHRYAGATMYVCLPVAGWLVYLGSRSVESWDPSRKAVRALTFSSDGGPALPAEQRAIALSRYAAG